PDEHRSRPARCAGSAACPGRGGSTVPDQRCPVRQSDPSVSADQGGARAAQRGVRCRDCGLPMGAMVAGLGAGALVRRFGSARVAVVGTLLTSLGIFAAGAAPTVWVFVLALLLGGGMDAITDVAQNTHGLRVQRLYRRSILNYFPAVWSIGAVLGGAMAAGAIALEVPLPLHLGTTAVVFSVVSLVALRFTLPGRERSDAAESPSAPAASRHTGRAGTRVLLALLAL